nr:MAG TPA_asm: hypothetical protein [Bacteriophage sp.]
MYGLTLVLQHYGLTGENKVYQEVIINIDGKYQVPNLLLLQIMILRGLLIVNKLLRKVNMCGRFNDLPIQMVLLLSGTI